MQEIARGSSLKRTDRDRVGMVIRNVKRLHRLVNSILDVGCRTALVFCR